MPNPTPKLFEPLKLAGLTLPNRIVVSPMCMYSAENGLANDFHMVHLGQFALAGVGLIITEATAVAPEGRISPQDLGIWSDDHIDPLKRITDFTHSQGRLIGTQLAHAGRKASTYAPFLGKGEIKPQDGGWQVLGPSALAFSNTYPTPLAMTQADILRVTADFVAAAQRADKANFDVIELHAAHGYLLHQFLSPLANVREDEYGGSFENRTRFVLEVTRAVRAVWPQHKPLVIRLSATDWAKGGWDIEQTVALARLLEAEGVTALDVSSGGLTTAQSIEVKPAYQVQFAAQIKQALPTLAIITVGMIDTPELAESILQAHEADLIALARPLLGDPHWAQWAAKKLGGQTDIPAQYQRGMRLS